MKERGMNPEQKQQAVRAVLKKVSQAKGDSSALASLVGRHVPASLSQEEMLREITTWLLLIRDGVRQGVIPSDFPVSRLIAAFQEIAREKEIGPDRLCSTLLEKMVLEAGTGEDPRTPPKHATKEKILEAALEVFSEKGFHSATVDEIADRAGVGKGTLYRYFANKETLFNELVRLRLEELEKSAEAVLDGQDDVLTMIGKYLRTYFEFFDRNQKLYRLVLQERLDVGKQVQDLYLKKVMRRIPLLKRKIYAGSQQGVLKEVDFQTVFYGVMGFMHGVIQKWLASDCSYSLVEDLPTVMDVLFYGFVKNPERVSLGEKLSQEEENGY